MKIDKYLLQLPELSDETSVFSFEQSPLVIWWHPRNTQDGTAISST